MFSVALGGVILRLAVSLTRVQKFFYIARAHVAVAQSKGRRLCITMFECWGRASVEKRLRKQSDDKASSLF